MPTVRRDIAFSQDQIGTEATRLFKLFAQAANGRPYPSVVMAAVGLIFNAIPDDQDRDAVIEQVHSYLDQCAAEAKQAAEADAVSVQ